MKIDVSTIYIVNDIQSSVNNLIYSLPLHDTRVIKNEEEGKYDFLISHAKLAIKEAYIAVNRTKYIILAGDTFKQEAQNSLLKILEEPPINIIFIIVTTSKNSILPTILSRMPHKYLKTKQQLKTAKINLKNLDLKEIYTFLKENQRISKLETKEFIESLMYKAAQEKIKFNEKQLKSFETAIKLCNLNSRPINILTTLLLNLIQR